MRVLLVHPDFQRGSVPEAVFRQSFNPPALGVNVLADVLRAHGHEAEVLDSLRLVLRYGLAQVPSFEDEVSRLVGEHEPDVLGLNVTSPTRLIALRCARAAKAAHPGIRIVFGGPHPTIVGPPLLDRYAGLIDVLVSGEGEETFPHVLNALATSAPPAAMPGVHWPGRSGAPPEMLRDLDCYPKPSYLGYSDQRFSDLFDTFPVMTARGCPYRCSFCYSKDFWSGRFRKRGVERVLEEIEYGLTTLGCTKIHFNDDMFSLPLDRGKAVLRGMLKRGLRAPMYCTTRIDCLDEEFLKLYEDAGGGCIYFGIESGSERLRDSMEKRLATADIEAGIRAVRSFPAISVGFFLIFGYPGESAEDIQMTEDLLQRTGPDEVTCNIAHVHPETALFAKAKALGLYQIEDWLLEQREFFPCESDLGRLSQLHRLCRRIEAQYGQPIFRGALTRDQGSVATWGLEEHTEIAPAASLGPRGGPATLTSREPTPTSISKESRHGQGSHQ